jgi:hypothetical protein
MKMKSACLGSSSVQAIPNFAIHQPSTIASMSVAQSEYAWQLKNTQSTCCLARSLSYSHAQAKFHQFIIRQCFFYLNLSFGYEIALTSDS